MIKPIETIYKGYRFRSRLEARWAVFFDALGARWEYEKEGYDLDGMLYLPDFWLPEQDCWVEIKAENPNEQEREKAKRLALATQKHVFILYGTLEPFSQEMKIINGEPGPLVRRGAMGHAWYYRKTHKDVHFSDTFHMFGECSLCHNIVIAFWGESSQGANESENPWSLSTRNDCNCHNPTRNDFRSPRLIAAYAAARQARFEHGDQPYFS